MIMSELLHPRLDILPASQRRLWPLLKPLADQGFVLCGGTAVALRLGHRSSVDFDFFSEKPLDRAALSFLSYCAVVQDEPDSLTVIWKDGGESPVKVSTFGNIRFGRVGTPQLTDDGVALVASLDDLLAQKLKVVMQRLESKDYRDIAAILRSGADLSRGLECALALFVIAFAPSECARALVYFKGGDLDSLPASDRSLLEREVARLGNDFLPSPKLSERLSI